MRLNVIKTAAAFVVAALVVSSCGKSGYQIVVTNTSDVDRVNETIDIPVESISHIPAESLTVLENGRQIPCQVYTNANGAEMLLFQVNVNAGEKVVYDIKEGVREEFETKAYSRFVPERLDDYAYENNVIAGRIYGPALETPRTYGADVWVKSTDRLIIDEWYAKDDYHHNYGEGMDCYKVDKTLGGGAWAPINSDFEVVLGDNYATYKHICDGPIRTEAVFEYDAVDVEGREVAITRVLSLDANSHFIKNVVTFKYGGKHLAVALAAVKHDVDEICAQDNWVAFTEPASDTDDPYRDGDISIALVYAPTDAESTYVATDSIGDHAGVAVFSSNTDTYTGWVGSGWSQGGVESAQAWREMVADFAEGILNPLRIELKK